MGTFVICSTKAVPSIGEQYWSSQPRPQCSSHSPVSPPPLLWPEYSVIADTPSSHSVDSAPVAAPTEEEPVPAPVPAPTAGTLPFTVLWRICGRINEWWSGNLQTKYLWAPIKSSVMHEVLNAPPPWMLMPFPCHATFADTAQTCRH